METSYEAGRAGEKVKEKISEGTQKLKESLIGNEDSGSEKTSKNIQEESKEALEKAGHLVASGVRKITGSNY